MSIESVETNEAAPEAGAEDTGSGRRGRPRPQETIERDDKVVASLQDSPKTTGELAEELGVEKGIAYLSIYRLRREGRVQKQTSDKGRVWVLV